MSRAPPDQPRRGADVRFIKVLVVAVFALACVSAGTASAADAPHAPWGYQGGALGGASPHPMALGPAAQADSGRFRYQGGPVVSHVSIQSVYWGNGQYLGGTGPGATDITEFFQGVADSPYMDW